MLKAEDLLERVIVPNTASDTKALKRVEAWVLATPFHRSKARARSEGIRTPKYIPRCLCIVFVCELF